MGVCQAGVERTDFSCSFCQALFTTSYNIIGDGDSSVVFNVLVDCMALGYIFSALYLFFRLQRSYSYLQKSSLNTSSREMSPSTPITTSSGNRYTSINIQDDPWDKNFGIRVDHPIVINSTYFKYTLFVSLWLAFEGLLLLFLPPTSMAYPTAVIIVSSGHIITDNWVLIFLYGKEDDKFSARRSFYICTIFYLIITITSLASVFDNPTCKTTYECQLFMLNQDAYTRFGTSFALFLIYSVVLFITIRKSIIRVTGRIWLGFLIGINFVGAIGYLFKILNVDFGFCFLGLANIVYAFLYGPFLFRTCGNDTSLLKARSEFLPLLTNFQEYTSLFGRESISTSGEGASTALQLSAFYIRYNEFKFGQIIGEGYFGEVRKATWKGAVVAIKVLHRNSFRNTDNTEENVFLKEVAILSLMRHPNVLQFLGVCSEANVNCIVTEYMGGGSLDRLIQDRYFLFVNKPEFAWKICLDIAKGMFYLHDWKPNPILHRDLSTKNILLDESFSTAKVADFGLSREQGFEMTASVGFLPFQAPEVFIGELYTPKADVYSFGILVWCIISGEQPNQNLQPLKMAHLAAYENYRPPIPTNLASPLWQPLVNLAQMCWKAIPEERPSFGFILEFLEVNMPSPSNNNNSMKMSASSAFLNSNLPSTSISVSAIGMASSDDENELFGSQEVQYIGD
ncbi:hypothetical protein CYY_004119 [Polysphondylium violaceum]|uniref:Protein kinase domain-containing protein n=1 Tax=Polysphondylium violaceum TaxID=133409 RepID=A0A8J4PV34_9MYCE|nr:hypothetical protein CYY_004119 [Polysphondylium violaceum]